MNVHYLSYDPVAPVCSWSYATEGPELWDGTSFGSLILRGGATDGVVNLESASSSEPLWRSWPNLIAVPYHIEPSELSTLPLSSAENLAEESLALPASIERQGGSSRSRRNKNPEFKCEDTALSKRENVLAKNRRAANRSRKKHKEYIKKLVQRCHVEMERKRIQSSLVKSLQHEIAYLKEEIFKKAMCSYTYMENQLYIRDCLYIQAPSLSWRTPPTLTSDTLSHGG